MKKIRLLLLILFMLIGVYLMPYFKREQFHRFMEYFGLTHNELVLEKDNISPTLDADLVIKWVGDLGKGKGRTMDTITIYQHKKVMASIPDCYGKTHFLVSSLNCDFKAIGGIYKFKSWYKHKYIFDFEQKGELLLVNWEIKNSWENHIGKDSVVCASF